MNKKGQDVAIAGFHQLTQHCKTEEEVVSMACMIATQALMLLRGMEGNKFVKDFCKQALKDKTSATIERVQ